MSYSVQQPRKKRRSGIFADLPTYYRCPERPDDIDPLCLENARDGVMLALRWNLEQYATCFDVPVDVLHDFVCDWMIFERAGTKPIPADEFVEPYNEVLRKRRGVACA